MINSRTAFFLGARRTAQAFFLKRLFGNAKATMNDGRVEFAVIGHLVRPGSVVLDVGAHVGVFARRFSELQPDCTVVAFEPQSLPRAVFTMVGYFRRSRKIIVLPFAVGAEPTLADLSVPIKDRGGVGIGLAHIGDDGDLAQRFVIKKEVAAVVRIDDVMERLDLGPASFIKVDVEGGELNALRGAEAVIDAHKPAILCEIDGRESRFGSTTEALFEFLQLKGYKAKSLESGRLLSLQTLEKNTLFVHGA
ncbi:MAG: FkbM family methyltransferase [Pseudomonadota bacterium]